MPSELENSSSRVLEFEPLREFLRGYTSSPLGQARIAALTPSIDATGSRPSSSSPPKSANSAASADASISPDCSRSQTLSKNPASPAPRLKPRRFATSCWSSTAPSEWREIASESAGRHAVGMEARSLTISEVADFSEFLRAFRNKIQPDGTLEDRASPELARIRREIEKQSRAIQESLRGYLRRLAEGGAVQDELITIRGERFVIPVKIEQKRRVQGVVHGASSSGQTVFVEPLETIEQNNELVRLLDEELAEIHRILLEMTRRIGESAERNPRRQSMSWPNLNCNSPKPASPKTTTAWK